MGFVKMTNYREFADNGLRAETIDHVGFLTIERPQRKNAVTELMWREFSAAIDFLATQKDVRAICIKGGGGSDFSAGADIREFDTVRRDAETAQAYESKNSAAFRAVRMAPVPVIAAIRGICFGGGFGLAAAADIRIADETAIFAIPAGRLGLSYPQDAIGDIVEGLGIQMAKSVLFGARRLTAADAHACGFLLDVSSPAQLDSRLDQELERIIVNAPLSNRASKAAIRAYLSASSNDATIAKRLGDQTFESDDYAEGRQAFREKRRPVFTGR